MMETITESFDMSTKIQWVKHEDVEKTWLYPDKEYSYRLITEAKNGAPLSSTLRPTCPTSTRSSKAMETMTLCSIA
jgi:phosphodiesterase/alkaline phosphatase D-like protein